MELSSLTAISPIDGRYGNKTTTLRALFSEYGLMHYRIQVEIAWLVALSKNKQIREIPALKPGTLKFLNKISTSFNQDDAERIKKIESTTNHDVKAIEYFLNEKISGNKDLEKISGFIHFACTSEDINNISHALILRDARDKIILPSVNEVISSVNKLAKKYASQAMISRTHGQTASPTTLGKEMSVFAHRLTRQVKQLQQIEILGKFNGAVGNYNAHLSAYPDVDWPALTRKYVESLGIGWNPKTTQIESHDYLSEYFHCLSRINNILTDFCRDIWSYISLGYFTQKPVNKEVGSSTMPHKINPIDFENAEGNFGIANSLLEHMAGKLPISRWQRDLTDSTVLRNTGTAVAHTYIAFQSCLNGMSKLDVNKNIIARDLENAWEVLAEPVQTVMRKNGVAQAYEKLKELTRGNRITKKHLHAFINNLAIPDADKKRLLKLTPEKYIGNAATQAKQK